jgi:hypothetical protein
MYKNKYTKFYEALKERGLPHFLNVRNSGMFWVWYPELSGVYKKDLEFLKDLSGENMKENKEVVTAKCPQKLIDDHWAYVEGILRIHGATDKELGIACHHYKTVFAHGWKHCYEALEEQSKEKANV